MKYYLHILYILCICQLSSAQTVIGKVTDEQLIPLEYCSLQIPELQLNSYSKSNGEFSFPNIQQGNYTLIAQLVGYKTETISIHVNELKNKPLRIKLTSLENNLNEVVVTGTMRETGKDDSPISIEVIAPKLFQRSNTPTLMEATNMVNGVRPQLNCNVCNTGDIHINGMEGPYTLVLIDGMPIVSGLSSVYGLSGIPIGMIERLEIAKGPSSSLYGSEAMGGTINVITKKPKLAPRLFMDYSLTGYLENNLDLNTKFNLGKKTTNLIGANIFWYDQIKDMNKDGFTDVTLQKRLSLFNKLNFERKNEKEFSIGARIVAEDRWGGEKNWTKKFRGGDSIYGESIITKRIEFISKYEWPLKEKIITQLSYNFHDQNSYYGVTPFMAKQSTGFMQTYWDKSIGAQHKLVLGVTAKHLYFDDNTTVTQLDSLTNLPEKTITTGVFAQLESVLDKNSKHNLLIGARLDHHPIYNFIPSPRIAYKWAPHHRVIARLNFGTGFRIVNVFTEDHASLTGARKVEFLEKIKPETSYNGTFNLIYKMPFFTYYLINWELSAFYYYFTNKIVANYDLDPNKVIYANLNGYAYTRGGSINANFISKGQFKFTTGITFTEVYNINTDTSGKQIKSWQLNTPKLTGNFLISYSTRTNLKFDVTGNINGPQRLAILPNDFRPEFSPWYALINCQISKEFKNGSEVYIGAKNILNFIPENPIMRPHDPFDKNANDPISNPNNYTFDPSYNYAPIQGIRPYVGLRWILK
ncbi:MAG: TonB-dependent receptor [Sphingobacteriaceae bacterium]